MTAVESAAQGVEAFLASLKGWGFDLLVSDVGMPMQDGYELIRLVRARQGATRPAAPLPLALTAHARAEDRAAALDAGFQAHVVKPFDPDALLAAVTPLVGRA